MNSLKGFSNIFEQAEESISDLEDKDNWNYPGWGTERKKNKVKLIEPEEHVGYHPMCQHIRYIGVTEEKEMKKGEETIFEKIMGRTSKIWGKT